MTSALGAAPTPAELRAVAASATAEVSGPLAGAFRRPLEVRTKSSAHDVVTLHDERTEARLVELLTAAVPGSTVLGEEGGRRRGAEDTPVEWIIDPIDGTSNFAHGFDLFSVSVAAAVRGVVVAGVVHAPAAETVFSAAAGLGAQLACPRGTMTLGAPSPRAGVGEAPLNLVTSYPAAEALRRDGPAAAESFCELVTTYVTVRRLISGALELCYAAAGWADVVLTVDTQPWDIAAGQLILQESGGELHPCDDAGRTVSPTHQAPHLLGLAPGVQAPTAQGVLQEICARRSG